MEKSGCFKEIAGQLPPSPFALPSLPIHLKLIKKFSIFFLDKTGIIRYILYFNDTLAEPKAFTLDIIGKIFWEWNVHTLQAFKQILVFLLTIQSLFILQLLPER